MRKIILLLWLLPAGVMYGQNIIQIPLGKQVNVDGEMNGVEWDDSDSLDINFSNNTKKVRVYYKHDGENLLACYKGDLESANVRFPEILLDMEFDRANIFQADDWWFHVSATDCEYKGRYGHYANCELERPNWKAVNNIIFGDPITDLVEISIPFSTINLNLNTVDTIGISFLITNTANAFHHWPNGAHRLYPITWGKAVFDKVGLAVDYSKEKEQFYLWPNPCKDRIYIKSYNNELLNAPIILYNSIGIKLKEIEYNNDGIPIDYLNHGIYFIQTKNNILKFIKE